MPRSPAILPAAALLALVLAASPSPAAAAWPHEPNDGNLPVCTAAFVQEHATLLPDGAGGAFVTWSDRRSGTGYDIYVQRISAAGAPLWTADGVALCTAVGDQARPTIAPDGAGGAIVTWHDQRGGVGNFDIFVQRISAAGAPQWTANGVALCTAASDQAYPAITTDGAGGAIVSWYDYRSGFWDIYAQRVAAAGTVPWTANGVALCTATNHQYYPVLVSDGAGGAIVAWQDFRTGAYDIYAQRVSAAGAVQWTANGVGLCTATANQTNARIAMDDAGGAIVTWFDYRSGTNYDVYAQRISAAGTPQWTANGVALCTAADAQTYPDIVPDGAGGAIVAWEDNRSTTNEDVYAQRISAAGVSLWTANGVALSTAAEHQSYPVTLPDGAGGAIVAWQDSRGGVSTDIYAQRISSTGSVQWTASGVAVSAAFGEQTTPALATDGAGGAIAAWSDARGTSQDIYAQRIERYGQLGNPEPVITAVKDVANDQGGFVKVSWGASYLDADPVYGVYEYRIFRSAPAFLARSAARRAVTGDSDVAVRDGALLARADGGATVYWEYVETQPAEAFAGYSRVVATTADSIAGSNPLTFFMVEARASTSLSTDRWASAPDSGYSVDDLAPAAPAPFTGEYVNGTALLSWGASAAPDLAEYRLYRGGTAGFVPAPGNLVVAQATVGYADAAGGPSYYKLCAVDVHGNVSAYALLLPAGTTDVATPALPAAVFLAPPSPNPSRDGAVLRFGLPREARVELALYDLQGRRVRSLLAGPRPAGEHAVAWDGRDQDGRALPAGVYLARLVAGGRTLVSRVAVVR